MVVLMRPLLLALLGLVALLAAPLPASAAGAPPPTVPVTGPLEVQLGIADQKPALFGDPRFTALGVRHVRRAVAWDTFDHDWQVREVDEYLLRAHAAGLSPLVVFDKSRVDARRAVVPTRAQLRAVFRRFRTRYPYVTDFGAWNEPNLGGQWPSRVRRGPERVGEFARDMQAQCPACRVVAADLVDYPNMVDFARRIAAGAGGRPLLWGVHNYVSANRFDASRTLALLKAVKGDVWLTEVGGLVRRDSVSTTHIPEGVTHAARVTSFIFDGLARLDPRIARVYLYHWNADPRTPSWDSGLVDGRGRARPALARVRSALRVGIDRRTVVLGAGFGSLRLGMSRAQAGRAGVAGVRVAFDRSGRVARLETTSRAWRTPGGTGVGSTAGQVAYAHLSRPSARACGRRTCVVGVREPGGVVSEFELDRRGRVARLVIRVV
jgi:hypothetical protein